MKQTLKIQLGYHIPENASLEQWVREGIDIYRRAEELTWHLADWAAFGEKKFGRLKEFCEAQGINYQTLINHAYVARSVGISRRREKLSFTHHAEVAPLDAPLQSLWLRRAEEHNWSVAELRRQIRRKLAGGASTESDGPVFRFADKSAIELHQFLSSQKEDYWTDAMKEFWRPKIAPIVHDVWERWLT
jgi:hypothetical protein